MRVRARGGVLLVSCYELGHQPLGLAMPLGFLERAGFQPSAMDIAIEQFDSEMASQASFVGISVPMHTALRLGVRVAERIRELNPTCHICFYGFNSKQVTMKYFTPELYEQFNSDNPAVADKADADWEQATANYRRHVCRISGQLPGRLRELAEFTCLHDEVDATSGGVFSHEILLSNGRTLNVKFVAFAMPAVSKADFGISRRSRHR